MSSRNSADTAPAMGAISSSPAGSGSARRLRLYLRPAAAMRRRVGFGECYWISPSTPAPDVLVAERCSGGSGQRRGDRRDRKWRGRRGGRIRVVFFRPTERWARMLSDVELLLFSSLVYKLWLILIYLSISGGSGTHMKTYDCFFFSIW
uniref:Uncharacterized protein n=1 Tax=Arundo donax TaxID=35708 RepID=A0A0A9GKK6_ARUDO